MSTIIDILLTAGLIIFIIFIAGIMAVKKNKSKRK